MKQKTKKIRGYLCDATWDLKLTGQQQCVTKHDDMIDFIVQTKESVLSIAQRRNRNATKQMWKLGDKTVSSHRLEGTDG
jgi:hypothetical protein